VTTKGVGWASEEVSDLVVSPLSLVLYMHLRIFAYTSNTLIATFEYMELMLAAGTLKNFRFLLRSCLSTDRAPVMRLLNLENILKTRTIRMVHRSFTLPDCKSINLGRTLLCDFIIQPRSQPTGEQKFLFPCGVVNDNPTKHMMMGVLSLPGCFWPAPQPGRAH
jgi:hypothetical protein